MPCHAAMLDRFLSIHEETTLEDALEAMKKGNVDFAVVVDDEGVFLGGFSFASLFESLLPVHVDVGGYVHSDITVSAAPGIAKRLLKSYPQQVKFFIDRDVATVSPQTTIWNGLSALQNASKPLVVLDDKGNGQPLGVITYASILAELQRMQDS